MKRRKFADGGGVGRKILDYITPKRPITPQNEEEFVDMVSKMSPAGTVGKAAKASVAAASEARRAARDATKEAAQAARKEALEKAVTSVEGGVPVTRYPAVKDVESRVTAREAGQSSRFGKGETPRLSDEWEGYKKGGKVSSASRRGDGIAQRGKTRGKMV